MSRIANYIGKTFNFTFLFLMLINILGFILFKMEYNSRKQRKQVSEFDSDSYDENESYINALLRKRIIKFT